MDLRKMFQQLERSDIEQHSRSRAITRYLGENTALTRVLDSWNMYVDTQDRSICPHLMVDGYWEMWLTKAVVENVRPGWSCVDIGANVGYYTLLLAELTRLGAKDEIAPTILAIEPGPRAFELLQDTAKISGYANIKPLKMAVGEKREDKVGLAGNRKDLGGIHVQPYTGDAPSVLWVLSLDAILKQCPQPVDFVKIDVEGYEGKVWRGMQGMLKEQTAHHPVYIMMEFGPDRIIETEKDAGAPERLLRQIVDSGAKLNTVTTDSRIMPVTVEEAIVPDTGSFRTLWIVA